MNPLAGFAAIGAAVALGSSRDFHWELYEDFMETIAGNVIRLQGKCDRALLDRTSRNLALAEEAPDVTQEFIKISVDDKTVIKRMGANAKWTIFSSENVSRSSAILGSIIVGSKPRESIRSKGFVLPSMAYSKFDRINSERLDSST